MTPQATLIILLQKDHFTKWLGLQIDMVDAGYCKLHYMVREDMLNGFGSIHGGVLFAASDSVFAFACNAYGFITVALDASINFVKPVKQGELLYVEAKEIHLGNKTVLYDIRTSDSSGNLVPYLKASVIEPARHWNKE